MVPLRGGRAIGGVCVRVAMLATAAFLDVPSTAALVWMAVASSWAAYFRPEGPHTSPLSPVWSALYAREEV